MLFALSAAVLTLVATATLTKPPAVLVEQPPVYPEEARAAGRGGDVVLRVTIDGDGRVALVEVLHGAGQDLDWAALGAMCGTTFSPALWDGQPGPAIVEYTIGFHTDATRPIPVVVDAAPAAVRAPTSFSGRVRRAGTVRPLTGAEVALTSNEREERAPPAPITVYADDEGRFVAEGVVEGPWHVAVSIEGYDPIEVDYFLEPHGALDLDFALAPTLSNEFETIVKARRTVPSVSSVSLSRAEVRAVPGTYGDALRVLESLPGVARAPLLGGALIVRGGVPADTGIFMDGVPLPVLYHFGGFTSVVNSSFLEEIRFYPGGFSPRYGNATAGVVEVESHALSMDTFEGRADVDLMDVGFFFGGPVEMAPLPKARFGFAARRSHLEIPGTALIKLLGAAGTPVTFAPVPIYDDWQAKLQIDALSWLQVSLFAFGDDDQWTIIGDAPEGFLGPGVDIDLEDLLNDFLGNHFTRWVGTVDARPLPGVRNVLTGYFGETRRGLLSEGVVVPLLSGASIDTPQTEQNAGVRDEASWRMTPWASLTGGVDWVWSHANLALFGGDLGNGTPIPSLAIDATTSTVGLYAFATVGPIGGLTLVPGARVELGGTTYVAGDGETPYDGAAQSVLPSTAIDPRVSLRWEPFFGTAWKAAFGTYAQRPRLQAGALDEDGVPLSPVQALHVIGGLEQRLTSKITIDAQVYGVRRSAIVRDTARLWSPEPQIVVPISQLSSFDSYGHGQTLGFELLLRHEPSKWFYGWIAYTFSRTDVMNGEQREPIVPSPFDQTHNLVLVGRVVLPWEFTLGGRFQFATGNPGPIPGSITTLHDVENGVYQPVLSSLRHPRLPPYHRFDARIDKKFTMTWASLTVFLDVINVYNYPNPEVVFPGGDYRSREVRTLLPGPPLLPLLGVEGEF